MCNNLGKGIKLHTIHESKRDTFIPVKRNSLCRDFEHQDPPLQASALLILLRGIAEVLVLIAKLADHNMERAFLAQELLGGKR